MGVKYLWISRNRKRYSPPLTQLQVYATDSQSGGAATTHNMVGVPAGALLVLLTGNQNSNQNSLVTSTPSLTWTKQIDAQNPAFPNNEIWTAVFAAGGNIDVTSDWGTNTQASTLVVMVGQGASPIGATAVNVGTGQASSNINLTTTKSGSIIVANSVNWNGVNAGRIYRGTATELNYENVSVDLTVVSYSYTALTAQPYTIGFTAPNDGDGGWSTVAIEITTGDVGPDTTPPSFAGTPLFSPGNTAVSVNLQWTAATDNIGVTGYEVYNGTTLVATVTGLTYTVTGLNPSTLYNFHVRAKDASGNGTDSNTISVTTNPSGGGGGGGGTDSDTFVLTGRTDDFSRFWGGCESWNKQSSPSQIAVGIPEPTSFYRRYTICDLCDTDGTMNWSKFDADWHQAANEGKKFSFGFMTSYPYNSLGNSHNKGEFYGGAMSAYPLAWHNQFQAESVKDWKATKNGTNDWVPPYNNASYKNFLNSFYANVNTRLQTATYFPTAGPRKDQLVRLKDMVSYIDVRGHGSYGEWHSGSVVDYAWETGTFQEGFNGDFPVGTKATIQTMKDLIDMHCANFADFWGCIILNVFDNNRFRNTRIDNEVGKHALTVTTNRGRLGWRRDQWSDNKDYYWYLTYLHTGTFSPGVSMASKIMSVWQVAPIVGEPPGYQDSDTIFNGHHMGYMTDGDTGTPREVGQVTQLHASMVGNGNFGVDMSSEIHDAVDVEMQNAAKLMGSRLQVQGGTMNLNIASPGNLVMTLQWQEKGLAPQYDKWDITFEIRNGASVLWSGVSSLDLELYLPTGAYAPHVDTFPDPALAPGTYDLYLKVKERKGFWDPLYLNNTGRDGTGAYFLCPITFSV